MIGTILEANPFLGRLITGRIQSGSIKPNQTIKVLNGESQQLETGRISKILAFRGLERTPIEYAEAGDIVAIAGLQKGTVADTFCDRPDGGAEGKPKAHRSRPDRNELSFIVNDSQLAGTERQGDERDPRPLLKKQGNVALKIEDRRTRTPSSCRAAANCSSPSSSRPCAARASRSASRVRVS